MAIAFSYSLTQASKSSCHSYPVSLLCPPQTQRNLDIHRSVRAYVGGMPPGAHFESTPFFGGQVSGCSHAHEHLKTRPQTNIQRLLLLPALVHRVRVGQCHRWNRHSVFADRPFCQRRIRVFQRTMGHQVTGRAERTCLCAWCLHEGGFSWPPLACRVRWRMQHFMPVTHQPTCPTAAVVVQAPAGCHAVCHANAKRLGGTHHPVHT